MMRTVSVKVREALLFKAIPYANTREAATAASLQPRAQKASLPQPVPPARSPQFIRQIAKLSAAANDTHAR